MQRFGIIGDTTSPICCVTLMVIWVAKMWMLRCTSSNVNVSNNSEILFPRDLILLRSSKFDWPIMDFSLLDGFTHWRNLSATVWSRFIYSPCYINDDSYNQIGKCNNDREVLVLPVDAYHQRCWISNCSVPHAILSNHNVGWKVHCPYSSAYWSFRILSPDWADLSWNGLDFA